MRPRTTIRTHVVAGRAQRRALASPLRLEITGFFENRSELSVRDVAERLGRPVASMYFHIHKLVEAGLLVESGTRGRGVGAEVLYRAVADRIALPLDPRSPASVEALVSSVRALLRQVGREFDGACRSPALVAHMTGSTTGRRQRVRLSDGDAAEARRRLDAVERFLMRKSSREHGTEYTWTSLLIPVAAGRRHGGAVTGGGK